MTNEDKIKYANAIRFKQRYEARAKEVLTMIGGGYNEFWDDKHRYRVVKGGRGSKKSRTTGMWFIHHIMAVPLSNAVVIRKTGNTHKDSTFAELKWSARRQGVYDDWKFTVNPMEATYLPTGQKILFRGLDDPLKLTSLAVEVGHVCWQWWEEAFEIEKETDFDTVDEGLRGEMPSHLWKQITITYNPWVNNHWTKERFFDNKDPLAFTLTTTHKCNEFLDQADHDKIEALAITDPDRYKVVGLGDYGIPGGTFFDNWRSDVHVIDSFKIPLHWDRFTVTDYGLDMEATMWFAIDERGKAYGYKQSYKPNLIISEAAEEMLKINNKERMVCHYGPPDLWNRRQETGKSAFDIFCENGWPMVKADNNQENGCLAVKEWLKVREVRDEQTGKIVKIADMVFFKNCVDAIRCIPQVQTDEKNPNIYSKTPHELTHIVDAVRYFAIMRTAPSAAAALTEKPSQFNFIEKPKEGMQVEYSNDYIKMF